MINSNELYHYGVLGMRWGVRHKRKNVSSQKTKQKSDYDIEKHITVNPDGSKNISKGFKFNRVGKTTLDVNKSGALYVSYGKEDAARYIKNFGPTPLNKLLKTHSEAVQRISVKSNLKMASDAQTNKILISSLAKDKKALKKFNDSIYAIAVTGDYDKEIDEKMIRKALSDCSSKEAYKLGYGISSILADPNYVTEAKNIYSQFRKAGYDAIPDTHDRLSGTSKTAMIIINPNKIEMTSSTVITKDMLKKSKKYVRKIGKLKTSELIR